MEAPLSDPDAPHQSEKRRVLGNGINLRPNVENLAENLGNAAKKRRAYHWILQLHLSVVDVTGLIGEPDLEMGIDSVRPHSSVKRESSIAWCKSRRDLTAEHVGMKGVLRRTGAITRA